MPGRQRISNHGARLTQNSDLMSYVRVDGLAHRGARRQGRADVREEGRDLPGNAPACPCGRHRPALRVPENDEGLGAQDADGVLERCDLLRSGDVAGHAHGEDVAEALVEEDLDRHARVGAPQNRGVRCLTLRELAHTLDVAAGLFDQATDEALVSVTEPLERLAG